MIKSHFTAYFSSIFHLAIFKGTEADGESSSDEENDNKNVGVKSSTIDVVESANSAQVDTVTSMPILANSPNKLPKDTSKTKSTTRKGKSPKKTAVVDTMAKEPLLLNEDVVEHVDSA